MTGRTLMDLEEPMQRLLGSTGDCDYLLADLSDRTLITVAFLTFRISVAVTLVRCSVQKSQSDSAAATQRTRGGLMSSNNSSAKYLSNCCQHCR